MDGVTILNTYQEYSVGWSVILVMAVVAAGFCLAISISYLDYNIIISGFFAGLCAVLVIACFQIPMTRTEYAITLDDSVSWNELTNHYKVISIRGKILKVEEKEQGNEKSIDAHPAD